MGSEKSQHDLAAKQSKREGNGKNVKSRRKLKKKKQNTKLQKMIWTRMGERKERVR